MTRTPAGAGMSWRDRRACVDAPPSLFFPEVGENAATAKAICAGCPVRVECLEYAIDNREDFGVWGGLAPWERHKVRRRPPKRPLVARCGTEAGYYRHVRQTLTEPCGACREAHAVAERLRRHRMVVVR